MEKQDMVVVTTADLPEDSPTCHIRLQAVVSGLEEEDNDG